MDNQLLQTPLYQWHVDQGARMVDFANWSMPVQYQSIVQEHQATRNAVTMFDVSHMGRIRFDGPGGGELLDRLLTRSVLDMQLGQVRYSLICNHEGGILDDVLIYHLESPTGVRYFLLVVNASNRQKIVEWITAQWPDESDVEMQDRTVDTAMLAVQGPAALETLQPLFDFDISAMKYFRGKVTTQMKKPCILSRTGYTGEDGFELILKADQSLQVTQNIFAAGRAHDISPAGLGARDTLRMESAMPLYGHELNEQLNPLEAGLGFAVSFQDQAGNDRDFIGCQAIRQTKTDGVKRTRIGLQLDGKRAAREGYAIYRDGQTIGEVTSGSFSPTLQHPIAMGYVNQLDLPLGSALEVDVRGKMLPAITCQLPFYKRT
ncbi:MAG TPA: glycine cleavage system aminomethyltransferase GcvT [Planctomycetes bacterium]|nr:glycine cleavage system aminomethyltransferase GcvT [Planctomycetaceae bacterium]HIN54850.1 glycine cleavage system aminomethyltransferase GcvT [Planctomycetota bacterium]